MNALIYEVYLYKCQRIGGKFWLSANHNRYVKATITYAGGDRVWKIVLPFVHYIISAPYLLFRVFENKNIYRSAINACIFMQKTSDLKVFDDGVLLK
jgi:hypothetical protein